MSSKCLFIPASLAVLFAVGIFSSTYAAPITWGSVFNIVNDADISPAGVLVEAVNVGADPMGLDQDIPVYVRADQSISYGNVIEIVDQLKVAGVKFVAMSTRAIIPNSNAR